jgi:hypothetical protein
MESSKDALLRMGKQIFPKIIDNCKKMEIPKNNDGVKKV